MLIYALYHSVVFILPIIAAHVTKIVRIVVAISATAAYYVNETGAITVREEGSYA